MRVLSRGRAEAVVAAFDLTRLNPAFYADPYPVYHALRELRPVHRMASGSVLLTRHADLEAIYKDTTLYSSDKRIEFRPKFGDGPLFEHHTTSLVFNDPPLHTRVRRIIAGALSPRAVTEMEGPVTALVDGLLDQMAGRGEVDLIEDFAAAIPVEVIGNLLDVPREERGPLRDWSLAILGALEPVLTSEQLARGNRAVTEFLAYLRILVATRRAKPGDPEKDVLTRLIGGEGDGAQLTEMELMQNCIFILNAGHETTTNLIGNGLVLLTQWPEERRRLIGDPSLIKSAVEEMLRFESSNQLGNRMTTAPVTIGGEALAAGTSITLGIGAANRDPAVFSAPDRFDITRRANRHLAFASGPHQCVGLAVARLEGRIAIERFLGRFPRYALAGRPRRGGRARFRGFLSVPARLEFARH
ncbi:MAG TPA: cytochrome P450 [Hyphomicrobiaceae bacterium]|nr:cytochrome P450 [Hyphomicrobiaceae bacterium]